MLSLSAFITVLNVRLDLDLVVFTEPRFGTRIVL